MTTTTVPRLGSRPVVWVWTCSSGGAHHAASSAIAEGLRALGATQPVLCNAHDVLSPAERWFFARGQFLFLNHLSPLLHGAVTQAHRSTRISQLMRNLYPLSLASVHARLKQENPAVIVSTHALSTAICSRALTAQRKALPLISLTINYSAHSFHVQPGVTAYCVPHAWVANDLRRLGVPENMVHVAGMPLDPVFDSLPSSEEARTSLGLPLRQPVVLISQGMSGTGMSTLLLVRALTRELPGTVHIVVLCGTNDTMRTLLSRQGLPPRVHVRGFVPDFWRYLRAADLLVGKAGGMSSASAFACGTPLVLFSPNALERLSAERFVAAGAAASGNHSVRHTVALVAKLLADPRLRDDLRAHAAEVFVPQGRETIARLVQSSVQPLLRMAEPEPQRVLVGVSG